MESDYFARMDIAVGTVHNEDLLESHEMVGLTSLASSTDIGFWSDSYQGLQPSDNSDSS